MHFECTCLHFGDGLYYSCTTPCSQALLFNETAAPGRDNAAFSKAVSVIQLLSVFQSSVSEVPAVFLCLSASHPAAELL